jgi:hypothetical protein
MGRKSSRIGGQFAPLLIDMLESPAWRVLSLSARKVLNRIEIELASHGGKDNGALPVTYDDFVRYGVHRQSIRPAINELIALGFVEITRKGRAGNAEFREPNLFRLTYRHSKGGARDGTHEWRSIKNESDAARLAKAARAEKLQNQCRKPSRSGVKNRYRKSNIHSTQTMITGIGTESGTTLDISGRVSPAEPAREARLPRSAVASEPAENESFIGQEDPAALQVNLANRLGDHGWSALLALSNEELDRVIRLGAQGLLDERELHRLRAKGHRKPSTHRRFPDWQS